MSERSQVSIRIDGEVFLTFEAVGECYECEVAWLRRAYDAGLLGGGRMHGGLLLLPAARLDRVAQVVRLSRYEGLAFETILALLGDLLDEEADIAAGSTR